MPFDAATFPAPVADAPPAQPCAAHLSRALRDRSLWPVGFVWDYTRCETCMLGLAGCFWPTDAYWQGIASLELAEAFGLPQPNFDRVAFQAHDAFNERRRFWQRRLRMETVTPEHVADALDLAVATRAASTGAGA